MKRECAVVQDLLVLYEDDVLLPESRRMVEEHIEVCAECRKVYEKTSGRLPEIRGIVPGIRQGSEKAEKEQEDMAVKAILKFKRKMTFDHMIIAAIILIAVILAENLLAQLTTNEGNFGSVFSGMSPADVEVKETYRLKNGDIYMVFSSEKEFCISERPRMETPMHPRGQDTDEAYFRVSFEKADGWLAKLQDVAGVKEAAYIFPMSSEGDVWNLGDDYVWNCKEISYFGAFKNDKKLLWTRGQEVKAAPDEIEKMAIAAYMRGGSLEKAEESLKANGLVGQESIYEICEEYAASEFDSYDASSPDYYAYKVYKKPAGTEK